ncbi:MAG: hypothetical protein AB7S70_04260 [Hyphomicrobium sp.]|uniref:hypothetical protein n=1 Tax=Hyphomicrobium sp. TaxID=82 RepID=UPI003D115E73
MTGGFMVSAGRLSLLAAAGFLLMGGASAQAADLGGDCCADLEERIAELEATTARKGNRKVKLEVSGHVNEALIWWDDSVESNAGIYTNDAARTRFRFKGDAKIADGWKAGYLLEIGVRGANSKRFDQDNDNAGPDDVGLDLRHSTWYVDSKSYGRVWVGLTGGAGESVTEINVAGTGDVAKYSDVEDLGGGLALRRANGNFSDDGANGGAVGGSSDNIRIRRLIRDGGDQPGEGRRYNMVRYDTPEIFGFVGTVNWGEDDTWEVGFRYKGEFSGFKIAAGLAYGETTEPTFTGNQVGFQCVGSLAAGGEADCNQLGGSISVMHEPTGLYVNAAGGYMEDEAIEDAAALAGFDVEKRHEFYAIEAGLQQKWFPIGKTTVFGQYYHNDGGTINRDYDTVDFVLSSELDIYSIGIMQGVDAAAMNFYALYRNVQAEANTSGDGNIEFEDVDLFLTGAIIKF